MTNEEQVYVATVEYRLKWLNEAIRAVAQDLARATINVNNIFKFSSDV